MKEKHKKKTEIKMGKQVWRDVTQNEGKAWEETEGAKLSEKKKKDADGQPLSSDDPHKVEIS